MPKVAAPVSSATPLSAFRSSPEAPLYGNKSHLGQNIPQDLQPLRISFNPPFRRTISPQANSCRICRFCSILWSEAGFRSVEVLPRYTTLVLQSAPRLGLLRSGI
jgi:hypothetical protein